MAKQKEIIQAIVEAHIATLPTTGGITIDDVKADTDIASVLSLKHANTTDHAPRSDDQDLSNLVVKETGKGLSTNDYLTEDKNKLTAVPIITVSATEPQNPTTNQIWIDIS